MRVLLVVDDPGVGALVRSLLAAAPHVSVATSPSLAGARVLLGREAPDVVLAATELPDAGPDEVIRQLATEGSWLPVVLLTSDDRLARDALRCGAQDAIDPARTGSEQLLRALQHATDRHAAARPGAARDGDPVRQLLEDYTRAVAHDVQRPLATIQVLARAIAKDLEHGLDTADLARRIDAQAADLQEFTNTLLADSVGDASSVHDVRLAPLISRALDLYGGRLDAELVSIDVPDDLEVAGREAQLLRALLNLLGNVTQHAGPHPTVAITARVVDGEVLLTIDDDGPGVPREDHQRILAPGTRLDPRVHGHGLGLASVDLVARAHGGRVVVEDSPLGGLRVGLALPSSPRVPDLADPAPRTREG